jgi:hypothetical protein
MYEVAGGPGGQHQGGSHQDAAEDCAGEQHTQAGVAAKNVRLSVPCTCGGKGGSCTMQVSAFGEQLRVWQALDVIRRHGQQLTRVVVQQLMRAESES